MLKIIVAIILIIIMTLCEIGVSYFEDKRASTACLYGVIACMIAIVIVSV
jgi:hypothetical protein